MATMAAGFSVKNLGNTEVYKPQDLINNIKKIL